jgi:hypothetical protein
MASSEGSSGSCFRTSFERSALPSRQSQISCWSRVRGNNALPCFGGTFVSRTVNRRADATYTRSNTRARASACCWFDQLIRSSISNSGDESITARSMAAATGPRQSIMVRTAVSRSLWIFSQKSRYSHSMVVSANDLIGKYGASKEHVIAVAVASITDSVNDRSERLGGRPLARFMNDCSQSARPMPSVETASVEPPISASVLCDRCQNTNRRHRSLSRSGCSSPALAGPTAPRWGAAANPVTHASAATLWLTGSKGSSRRNRTDTAGKSTSPRDHLAQRPVGPRQDRLEKDDLAERELQDQASE